MSDRQDGCELLNVSSGTGLPREKAVKWLCVCVCVCVTYYTRLPHPFNDLFPRTTWVSQYQKGKTSLDLNDGRHGGVWRWQWHQLDHMQTICISLQPDNHTHTSSRMIDV